MAGLLGFDPTNAALIGLGAGMTRGDFGGGLLGAGQAYQQAQDGNLRGQLGQLQLAEAQQKMEQMQRQQAFLQNLPAPTPGPSGQIPPGMDFVRQAVQAGVVKPEAYLGMMIPKPIEYGKIDPKDYTPESLRMAASTGDYSKLVPVRKNEIAPNGTVYNPYSIQPGQSFPDPNKPFAITADNKLVPNMPFQQFELNKAQKSAPLTQVSVNTDKSYFSNVAEGLAKNDVALIDAARSAPDRIASSRRVLDLLDRNPITGTGAEARLSLNKALSTAGLVDGTNVANTEMLASTLASQTLDAIKTSGLGSGQGFTDKDRQFLERAKSGNIEMNPQALRSIAELNERAARVSIQRGNAIIQKLRSSPQAGAMGQQLDPIPEPASGPSAPSGKAFDSLPPANTSNKGRFLTDTVTGKRYQSNGLSWVEVK